MIAHRHHVVEPVHTDPQPPRAARLLGDVGARTVDEDLLQLRRPVLADVARLAREDDERVAVRGKNDIRVAVHDLEAGEVRDGALEARVLGAGDDQRVELAPGHRGTDVGMAALQLGAQVDHEISTPLMSAVTASLSGVGTPSSRPKRAMPPFR